MVVSSGSMQAESEEGYSIERRSHKSVGSRTSWLKPLSGSLRHFLSRLKPHVVLGRHLASRCVPSSLRAPLCPVCAWCKRAPASAEREEDDSQRGNWQSREE
eukprot:3299963-Rhodomonas_salina.1